MTLTALGIGANILGSQIFSGHEMAVWTKIKASGAILLGILVVLFGFYDIYEYSQIEKDPATTVGIISRMDLSKNKVTGTSHKYTVEYTVNERRYTLTQEIDPEKYYKHQTGDAVTVRYYSGRHGYSDLPEIGKRKNPFYRIAGGFVFVLVGFIIVTRGRRRRVVRRM
jgi:hypothetical protein